MPYNCGLAEYLCNLYEDYKKNKDSLTAKFTRNLNSFKGIDIKQWKAKEGEGWRSKISIKLIKVKIFAAIAILCDYLLQGGKIPFLLKAARSENLPGDTEENAVDAMSDIITDQLVLRKADRETKNKIFSLGLYGMTFSKYDIEAIENEEYSTIAPEGIENPPADILRYDRIKKAKNVPGHRYVSVWNMFWDMEEKNPQKMRMIFEKGWASAYELRKKKGQSYYIDEAIDRALKEYQKRDSKNSDDLSPIEQLIPKRRKQIRILECWGRVPRQLYNEFVKMDQKSPDSRYLNVDDIEYNDEGDEIEILVEMADEEIIRIKERKPAKRPYKIAYWEEFLDETTGNGIADNGEDIQGAYVGVLRAIEDNSKLAGNVILALKKKFLEPGAFDELTPGMKVEISDACEDARQAIQQIVIQSMVEQLAPLLAIYMTLLDDITQIPKILHGFVVKGQDPQTAFQSNQLQENAGKYLGFVIRNYDDNIIEQEIKDLYDYNMMDPEVPAEKKCPCTVHATGFTGFQNKIIKGGAIREILNLVLSDQSGEMETQNKLDKLIRQVYESYDLDPDEFIRTEEEQMQYREQKSQAAEKGQEQARQAVIFENELKKDLESHKAELKSQEQEEKFQQDLILDSVKDNKK